MKKIYIVFIASEYKTGRFIRFLTRGRYNHVAISLTPELSKFYSFARSNYYEPLTAGYQIETPYRYIENAHKGTDIKICEVSVDEDKYSRIVERINEYNGKRDKTLYNFFDILGYPFKKHFKLKDAHTCVSFVQELLEEKKFLSISKFENTLKSKIVFEGNIAERCDGFETEEKYFLKDLKRKKYKRYAVNMGRLCKRMAYCGVMFVMQIADKII